MYKKVNQFIIDSSGIYPSCEAKNNDERLLLIALERYLEMLDYIKNCKLDGLYIQP